MFQRCSMRSFYELIGVNEDCTQDEIKTAYHNLLRSSHPDKGNCESGITVQLVSLIGKTLRDRESRDIYDKWLREQRLRASQGTIVESIEVDDQTVDHLVEYCRCGDEFDIDRDQFLKIVDIGVFECPTCSLCLQIFTMNGCTKIVVLGESGVGKTSFVNALCKNFSSQLESTVGAQISILWHDYRAGLSEQRAEMVEVWDIGGSSCHRPASTVFLDGASGIILVHDLTNRKSESNLGQWLTIVNGDRRNTNVHTLATLMADIERTHIPIMIVGTRLDQAPHRGNTQTVPSSAAARVNVDCRKEMPAGSSQAMVISRFLDAVIERGKGPSDPRRRKIIN